MRTGKRGKHQLAGIRQPLVNVHLRAALVHLAISRQIAEIQPRVHTLRVHIQPHVHDIQIAGALAVAEQRAFHALRPRQHRQLRSGNSGAAIVMRMHADDRTLAAGQMADKIFHLIGIGIRRAHFHRIGQIENNRMRRICTQRIQHRRANVHRVVHLGTRKALRRILIANVRITVIALGQLPNQLGAGNRNIDNARHILLEHHFALQRRGGIVKMHDDVFGAADRVEGLADEVFARLHQHLNGHVLRDVSAFDQLTADFIFRLRGGRKADLDLLEAHIAQRFEKFQLFRQIHRIHQRLIAVTEIHAAPDGCFVDHTVRPLAVRQRNLLKGNVLLKRWFHNQAPPLSSSNSK